MYAHCGSSLSPRSSRVDFHDSCVVWALLPMFSTSPFTSSCFLIISLITRLFLMPDFLNFHQVAVKYFSYFRWRIFAPWPRTILAHLEILLQEHTSRILLNLTWLQLHSLVTMLLTHFAVRCSRFCATRHRLLKEGPLYVSLALLWVSSLCETCSVVVLRHSNSLPLSVACLLSFHVVTECRKVVFVFLLSAGGSVSHESTRPTACGRMLIFQVLSTEAFTSFCHTYDGTMGSSLSKHPFLLHPLVGERLFCPPCSSSCSFLACFLSVRCLLPSLLDSGSIRSYLWLPTGTLWHVGCWHLRNKPCVVLLLRLPSLSRCTLWVLIACEGCPLKRSGRLKVLFSP